MTREKFLRVAVVVAATGLFSTVLMLSVAAEDAASLLQRADKEFENKNYKDALLAYREILDVSPGHPEWRRAAKRIVICNLRLRNFDAALDAADEYIERTKGTPFEARAERLAGNLWLLVPHWGTRAGGRFYRAQWKQGIQVDSSRFDKKQAVRHLERARSLYAAYDGNETGLSALPAEERKNWRAERLECLFDLASALSRFSIYENDWRWWYSYWAERDDEAAETAGEDDFQERYGYWTLRRKRPIGLRVDAEGKPVFPSAAPSYETARDDDQRILSLLAEIRGLDPTEERKFTALSYYRQAMLARSRFGMDRLNSYAGMYYLGGKYPLKEEMEHFKPWELGDSEALVLAGGRLVRVTLPPQWDVVALLRTVFENYRKSGVAPRALYAAGLYYQTRQQYRKALEAYALLRKTFPSADEAAMAGKQSKRIEAPEVALGDSDIQLPGSPPRLRLTYRNTSRIWFTVRPIDVEGFFESIRRERMDASSGLRDRWALDSWSSVFVSPGRDDNLYRRAARFIGPETARWVEEVEDDGTHRYSKITVQAPLEKRGAYLVSAYLEEPPSGDARKKGPEAMGLGDSRAVLVVSDLAFVEKRTAKGLLYYVCDARTGAPIPNASVSVMHLWNRWEKTRRKSIYYRKFYDLATDAQGFALLPYPARERYGSFHVLVRAGKDRIAWSGMRYWTGYTPSGVQDGLFAYCITDRPVYRPGQTVRFKVWVRRFEKGTFRKPEAEKVRVRVFDARGNKIFAVSRETDEFGGIDGEFALRDEARLGVYRLTVEGARYIGGANFRVEEYKKPEFEVSVEPDASQVRLGGKVGAVIRARYYFGQPVREATVKYKIFREEYTHSYYFPGEWDWLYGAGYGLAWYEYPWMPWWSKVQGCVAPPSWRRGSRGATLAGPVRELVAAGEAPIGEDGTLRVVIDTAPALEMYPDRDHRYIVEAEVRDASRRVVAGRGAVTATRRAFYAFVQADRGYYRPGEEMLIRVKCLTPDNRPIRTEGMVTVSEVVFGGDDNARIERTELKRWKASTDENGMLEFRLRPEKSGQLEIRFEAPDEWGGTVEGYGLVWVCGDDFDGKLYRFNDLELITDKRAYRPGETAHVMVNTRRAGSFVLFSDDVDYGVLLSWKLLHLPGRSVVVDVPVKEDGRPDFFVEATTVSDGRIHRQYRRICVPPEEGVMQVRVSPDKPEYRPGETASVRVEARTPDGEPVRAQIVLSVFDKSVLYIQPEFSPPMGKFFHGRLRDYRSWMVSNLLERFQVWGRVSRPYTEVYPVPDGWWGVWGPSVASWRGFSEKELEGLSYGGGMAVASMRSKAKGFAMSAEKPSALVAEAPPEAPRAAEAADKAGGAGPGATFVEARVRSEFADTAYWAADVLTGADGTAEVSFRMPDDLTTWKINAWGMTPDTRVGQDDDTVVATKKLLVRLQTPRFFVERDEVVVSANVHNYLGEKKTVRVSLSFPDDLFRLVSGPDSDASSEKVAGGPTVLDVSVPAGGEARVDWRLKVLKAGEAELAVKALTDEESDAVRRSFPVLVHGMMKQVASTGSIRPDETDAVRKVEITVPEERIPEASRLEIRFAPSLVGAMLDALPYLLDYPYGCTEQTLSRFVPAVLTLKTLQNMGVSLDEVKNIRGRMDEVRRVEKGERFRAYWNNPVFDEKELKRIIDEGLARIADMRHGDGGWGWWKNDPSSPYLTAYVLYSLCTARRCDLPVEEGMISRGMKYLRSWEENELREEHWRPGALHSYIAYVLSLRKVRAGIDPAKDDERPGGLLERLWKGRDHLGLYGKALLALALHNLGDQRAETALRNILQYKEENPETGVAWFRTPSEGWWYWWNSDIETNAWILRAVTAIAPRNPVAPMLVRWLLENRRNGYYWRSTRDTAICIAAMSDFAAVSGETEPDYTLTVDFDDGEVVKKIRISRDNFFTFDNRFLLEGVTLRGGKHTITISKDGPGALYYNVYLRYFTKEEPISKAGLRLKIERTYYRLERVPFEAEAEDAAGREIKEKRLRYKRVALKDGDLVESGDIVQVELRVKSDNDYTFLCFEDMKPAGFEAVQVRSGGKGQEGFWSYMELRDEKVVFFVNSLSRGEHLLRYRLRAEAPGRFHALPAVVYGMYVPELRANSNEIRLKVND